MRTLPEGAGTVPRRDHEDPDLSSRQRQKYLIELDKIRRQDCQLKISDAVVRYLQVSNRLHQEKCHVQENLHQNTREEFFRRAEEMVQKLEVFEHEEFRRNQQRILESQQHAKRVLEMNEMLKEVEKKQQEEEEEKVRQELLSRKMKEEITGQCHTHMNEFRILYGKFVEMMKSCKNKEAFISRVSNAVAKVKAFAELLESKILEKSRSFSLTNQDVELCRKAVQEVNALVELSANVFEELNQGVSAVDDRNKTAEEAVNEVKKIDEGKVGSSVQDSVSGLDEFVNKDAFKRYTSLKLFREEFAKSFETLLKDEKMKNFRFQCQKAVNTPLNAIAPSVTHLQDKLTRLHRLLSGQSVEVSGAHFSAAQHPEGIAFCKDLLAKKFVAQGVTTVPCKPKAAFPIAAVILALWVDFPDFGQLLLAYFHKECPYLVPLFMPQVEGQSNKDYYKALGYHYSADGEVENQDKFLKRMSGIMHLYAAIIVTPLKRSISKPHPLGVGEAWRWLACLVNLEPRPDICPTLLYEFLEVAGHSMFIHYKQIFKKLLHLLCTEYFPKILKETPPDSRGPITRLETFLQNTLKQGALSPPEGMLPPDFW